MNKRSWLNGCLILLLIFFPLASAWRSSAAQTGQVRAAEIKAFLYGDGGYAQPVTAGFTSGFDANGYGTFGWQFTNPSAAPLQNARLVVFLDADLDRDLNTFFNEYGAFVNLSLLPQAAPNDIAPSSWEIDEPGFLFGDLAQHLTTGVLDSLNSVSASAPDDVAMALSFGLGALPPNSPIKSYFFISPTNIGGLSQTDTDSNTKLWFNGYVNVNNPPTITAQTVTRQQGSPASVSTIATVNDDFTPAGSLTVTAGALPPGISLTGITNNKGTITANIAAACNAALGANTVALTVNDGTLTATTNLTINVTPNTPPGLGTYVATGIGFGASATVAPSAPPTDNGSITALTATIAPASFTGGIAINPATGAVTITNAAPVGNYTVTVTATDNCGLQASKTFALAINRVTSTISDPLACLSRGSVLSVRATVISGSATPQGFEFVATMPPQLIALSGTCTTSGGACTVSPTEVRVAGTLAAAQTINLSYRVQVKDSVAAAASFCIASVARFDINNDGAFDSTATTQACTATNCPAVGPGAELPAGSVLVYNIYTSSASNPTAENTRIALTNTDPSRAINVHLFFVDGASCSVADASLCLTQNQTTIFLASDLDPGTTGYLIVVAVDRNGCPVSANYLIGDEYVKFASGHAANLPAESFQALAGGLPACDDTSTTAAINFDGVSYTRAPRTVAIDNLADRANGNDTLLILNRLGGNLATGADKIGAITGLLYDDNERGLSFSFNPNTCQFRSSLSNNFPRTAPRFEQVIPAGRSGWLKLWQASDAALLGAAINFNPNAGTNAGAFNQGHNLHRLTLTSAASVTIPVFPSGC